MMIPSLQTRLRRVAATLRRCHRHGARLLCAVCDYTWTGTLAECEELYQFHQRLQPYLRQIPPTGGLCRCGEPRWCRPCYETAARQVPVPAALLTPAEWQRERALLRHVVPKAPPP